MNKADQLRQILLEGTNWHPKEWRPMGKLLDEIESDLIAAESKLAELDKQEPIFQAKSVGGLWLDVSKESFDSHHFKRVVYAKPKLAEPAQPIAQVSKPVELSNAERWKNLYLSEVRMGAGLCQKLIECEASKPQRITEQDAREIFCAYGVSGIGTDEWLCSDAGCTLLAKLNEHREPEVNNYNEAFDFIKSRTIQKLVEDAFNSGYEQGKNPKQGLVGAIRETYVSSVNQILSSQITANKTEVPTGAVAILFQKNIASQLHQRVFSYLCDANGKSLQELKSEAEQYTREKWPEIVDGMSVTIFDVSTLASLPPLKDGCAIAHGSRHKS